MADLATHSERRDHSDVLVLIPAFNEEGCVGQVVKDVVQLGYAALVIDDGSVDRTAEKAEREGATVLRLPVNLGVGGALRCGFRYAVTHGYSTVVQCDADGQHDPAEIAVLLDAMRTHEAELVIGSRFAHAEQDYHVGTTRRFVMHRLAHLATRRTGAPITDATSGFRAIGGRAARHRSPRRIRPSTSATRSRRSRRPAAAGYRVTQVGVHMRPRASGVSTSSSLTSIWYLVRVIAALWLQRFRPDGRRVVRVTLWESGPT